MRTLLTSTLKMFVASSLTLLAFYAINASAQSAWTPAPANAPSGNVAGPLTTGDVYQIRSGNLGMQGALLMGNQTDQAPGVYFAPNGYPYSYIDNSKGDTRIVTQDANANGYGSLKFIVKNGGNVGIGTDSPNSSKGTNGYLDAKDVYLRDAGKWASEVGGSGSGGHWAPVNGREISCTMNAFNLCRQMINSITFFAKVENNKPYTRIVSSSSYGRSYARDTGWIIGTTQSYSPGTCGFIGSNPSILISMGLDTYPNLRGSFSDAGDGSVETPCSSNFPW